MRRARPRPGRPARRSRAPARGWSSGSRRRWPCGSAPAAPGVTSFPTTPRAASSVQPLGEQPVVQVRVQLVRGRHRLGQHEAGPAGQPAVRPPHRGDLAGSSTRHGHREPGVAAVEAGEGVGAVAEHRHRRGLQHLQRGRDVEDRLHPRAHDQHRRDGPARRGRPRRPSSPAPRGAPRRGRRSRTPRPRPRRPARRSRPRSSRRRGAARRRRPRSRTDSLASPPPQTRSSSAAVSPTRGTSVEHRDGRGHGAVRADGRLQLVGDARGCAARAARGRAACSPARRRASRRRARARPRGRDDGEAA